jgi:hypothetical protein
MESAIFLAVAILIIVLLALATSSSILRNVAVAYRYHPPLQTFQNQSQRTGCPI